MDYAFERNNRLISLGITILFALLLFFIFLFIKFITPIPPFEQSGNEGLAIEVNIGYDEAGMGDNNSLQPLANEMKKENTASEPETNTSSEMLSSEEPNNVVAPPVKNKNTEVKVEEPKPDQNLLNALNKVRSNTGSNSGDGNTTTPGNQGDPNGTLSGTSYSEGGAGGDKWKLKGPGRKMIGNVEIGNESQETGIVAVEIMVDKSGKITRATPVLVGSTTTSLYLWNQAKKALENKSVFNQSPTGEEARGTIYINFTLR